MPDDVAVQMNVLDKVDYEFTSPDGPEADWRVYRMRLVEEINRPYEMTLDLATVDLTADTNKLLGANAELLVVRGALVQPIHGVVSEVEYLGTFADRLIVRVRVVPAFALLRQRVTSRIFQDMTVQDVVKKVLGDALGELEREFSFGSVSRGTRVRDYCVQYKESEFDFVCRLLEEEGISYYFAHDEDTGREVLTFFDDNAQLLDCENTDGSRLYPIVHDRADNIDLESLRTFDWRKALTPTSVLRQDYDFLTPKTPLFSPQEGTDDRGRDRRLYFHMRRRFITDEVEERATDHLQAATQNAETIRGESNAVSFRSGLVFELDRHDIGDLERPYVLTRVVHTGHCPEAVMAASDGTFGDDAPRYHNRIECVPLDVPIRPLQKTPKPRMHGPQTGIVSGPLGEEIHTDEHGRIIV